MAEFFSVSLSEREACTVVRVGGELDCATVPELDDAIRGLLASSTGSDALPASMEFDLADLTFCGSAGAALLARLGDSVRDAGIETSYSGAAPLVRRVFDIVGVDEHFGGAAIAV